MYLGKIEWRHVLGVGSKSKITSLHLLDNGKAVCVSSLPTTARVFDLTTGVFQWETTIGKDTTDSVYSEWSISSRDVAYLEINPLASGYELVATEYNSISGSESASTTIELPWFSSGSSCRFIFPHLICLHPQDDAINMVNVKISDSHQRIQLEDLIPSLNGAQSVVLDVTKNFVLLKTPKEIAVYRITDEGLKRIDLQLPGGTLLVSVPSIKDTDSQHRYLVGLVQTGKEFHLRVYDVETNEERGDLSGALKLPEQVGAPALLSTYLLKKPNGDLSYRYIIGTTDDSVLYGSKKEVYWTREESLTSIVQVEIVDLPVSSIEASIEEEFGSDQLVGGIFGHAIRRLSLQVRQLALVGQQLLAGQINFAGRRDSPGANSGALERDRFGLHKLILIVTRPGKLFAIDTISGRIVWQRLLKGVSTDKIRLYVQRTSIHYPLEPQCVILAKSSVARESVLFVFHPITGEPAAPVDGYVHLGYNVQQALLLPQNDETEYLKPLLLLDESAVPHVYPPTESATSHVLKMSNHLYLFTADTKSCALRGYSLAKSHNDQLLSTPVWQLQLCSSNDLMEEEIVSIVSRHPDEKVMLAEDRLVF